MVLFLLAALIVSNLVGIVNVSWTLVILLIFLTAISPIVDLILKSKLQKWFEENRW